jgi:hypothetical protein
LKHNIIQDVNLSGASESFSSNFRTQNQILYSYRTQKRIVNLRFRDSSWGQGGSHCPEAMEAHPGAVEAQPGALHVQPGAMEAHPGTMEAYFKS